MLNFHQIIIFYFYKGNEGKIHSYNIRKYNIKICCKIFFKVVWWLMLLNQYNFEN
jgi:hypothetical protein